MHSRYVLFYNQILERYNSHKLYMNFFINALTGVYFTSLNKTACSGLTL
jgi:hypothetical protein